MLAAKCPQCGAACPVSLATPERLACRYCGYHGPPPPEAQQAMHAAAHTLHAMRGRRTQLGALQRRSLVSAWLIYAAYLVLFGVVSVPFVVLALLFLLVPSGDGPAWISATLGLPPLVVLGVSGAFGLFWLWFNRRQLAQRCSAVPPVAPGEPARCHVCGAELVTQPREVIANCSYCGTDNLVASGMLQRIGKKQAAAVFSIEAEVRKQAGSFRLAAVVANAVVILGVLLAPLITIVGAVGTAVVLNSIELDPDESREYAFWETSAGECLAEVKRSPEGVSLHFWSRAPFGTANHVPVKSPDALRIYRVKDLPGIEVVGPRTGVARVQRVKRTMAAKKENYLAFGKEGWVELDQAVAGTCRPGAVRNEAVRKLLTTPDAMAIDGGYAVLSHDQTVYAYPLAGGEPYEYTHFEPVQAVAASATAMYWTVSKSGDLVYRIWNSKDRGVLATLDGTASVLRLDPKHVYAVVGGSIVRVAIATGKSVQIVKDRLPIRALALDGTDLVWVEGKSGVVVGSHTGKIVRAGQDGSKLTELATGIDINEDSTLGVSQQRIYLLGAGGKLLALSRGGSEPTVIAENFSIKQIAADATGAYLVHVGGVENAPGILRLEDSAANLDQAREIAPGLRVESGLVVTPKFVYWNDESWIVRRPR